MRGFYAMLDAAPDLLADDGALEARAKTLLGAAPCCLQLRAKAATARAIEAAGRRLLPLCRAASMPFCVNDRLDVALAVGADVVHLGQDNLPLADAQRVRAGAGRPEHPDRLLDAQPGAGAAPPRPPAAPTTSASGRCSARAAR